MSRENRMRSRVEIASETERIWEYLGVAIGPEVKGQVHQNIVSLNGNFQCCIKNMAKIGWRFVIINDIIVKGPFFGYALWWIQRMGSILNKKLGAVDKDHPYPEELYITV
jgi:hypothetical protein